MGFNGDLYPTAGATSVMTTKGDVVRYDSQRERYGIGSTNQVLQVSSGGLPAWQTLASGGLTVNKLQGVLTSTFTTSTAVYVATGLTLTLSTETDGDAMVIATLNIGNETDGSSARCQLRNDGSALSPEAGVSSEPIGSASSLYQGIALTTITDTDGSVMEIYVKGVGTVNMIYSSGNYQPQIIAMEFY